MLMFQKISKFQQTFQKLLKLLNKLSFINTKYTTFMSPLLRTDIYLTGIDKRVRGNQQKLQRET